MQIKEVTVANFRSIKSLTVPLASHCVVLGANNAGKSTVLKAIDLFFEAAPKLQRDDHFFGDVNVPIEVSLKFDKLTPPEIKEFGNAVVDGELAVTRELSIIDKETGIYSVFALANPGFAEFRDETNGTKKRGIFGRLLKEYDGLAAASTVEEMHGSLAKWEVDNEGKTEKTKIRNFFGAVNVANGKLKKHTSLRLIPAVKEAAGEFQDPKRSPVLGLLNDIATQIFENRKELQEFIANSKEEARKLTDPAGIPQLQNISVDLTQAVQKFYSDTLIEAEWSADEPLKVVFPTPKIILEHGGARVGVEYVGHGLQRAVLFAIVQYLAERVSRSAQGAGEKYSEAMSDIIILVEEPEIYQHPLKQKQIYNVFRQIASQFDAETGIRVQIVYTTHSEKLIDMADFDAARIIRKFEADSIIQTACNSITLEDCSAKMAVASQKPKPMPSTSFAAKLHIFNRDVSEGFFAQKVVLVEGASDKAILEGVYLSLGRNSADEGISIIQMSGKSTLDKPFLIFTELGIPTYLMFDSDANKREKKPATNVLLQRLCGVPSPIDFPEGVFEKFAALPQDLEKYLEVSCGESYTALMEEVSTDFELSIGDIRKTPAAVSALFALAKAKGLVFQYFDDVVSRVDALVHRPNSVRSSTLPLTPP